MQICPLILIVVLIGAMCLAFLVNRAVIKDNDRLILKNKKYELALNRIIERDHVFVIKSIALQALGKKMKKKLTKR